MNKIKVLKLQKGKEITFNGVKYYPVSRWGGYYYYNSRGNKVFLTKELQDDMFNAIRRRAEYNRKHPLSLNSNSFPVWNIPFLYNLWSPTLNNIILDSSRNKSIVEVDENPTVINTRREQLRETSNNEKYKPYLTDEVTVVGISPRKKSTRTLSTIKVKPKNTKLVSTEKGKVVTGYSLPKGITSVKATLKLLSGYGYNLGRHGIDGIWGKDTLRAYEEYIKDSTEPVSIKPSNVEPNTDLNTLPKTSIPDKTFDRSLTRELMRLNNLSPYSYSGATRRAVRLVLNREAGDNEKAIVKLYPELKELLSTYLKKGGNIYKFNNKFHIK